MLLLLSFACVHRGAPALPPTRGPDLFAAPAPTGDVGGDQWGFVELVSPTGRTVLLRRFPAAADGTAGPSPTFGHHGEAGPEPVPVVIDTRTGATREVDEIVAAGPDLRHALVIDEGKLWIVGTETGTWTVWDEPAPDLRSDGNACLPPRVAGFDDTGERVGVISGDRLHVRDLTTGATWAIPAGGPLWRGWPDSVGRAASLLVLDPPTAAPATAAPATAAPATAAPTAAAATPTFPRQRTSCACLWCNRFALSYSTYGWAGPAFRPIVATPAGPVTPEGGALEAGAVAIGEDLFVDAKGVRRTDGAAVPPPEGCTAPRFAVSGSESVPLTCGEATDLWWPATGRSVSLQGAIAPLDAEEKPVAFRAADGHRVVGVRLGAGYARLDLDTGELRPGPTGGTMSGVSPWGTLLVQDGATVQIWSLADGSVRAVAVPAGAEVDYAAAGFLGLADETFLVLDATGARTHAVAKRASAPTVQGCVLVATAHGDRDVERGPWRWACPSAPAG